MNTSAPPTVAERLENLPNGALAVRLSLARTAFLHSQTAFQRGKAAAEIAAIVAERVRREAAA